jgi:UDP-glucose:(heptosyl)LPS alpha-1,3-glucosyltransferase
LPSNPLPPDNAALNIALIILHADPTRGGAERYTTDLATALAGRGHRVSLLSSGAIHQRWIRGHLPGVPYDQVTLQSTGLTRAARYRRFLHSLTQHLDAERYDIVHAMLPVPRCDLYHPHAGLAAAAVAAGPCLSRWGNRFNRRRHQMAAVERQLLDSPSPPIVLCLSNYVKASVRRWYPAVPEDRLVRLFNGTDLARFDPAARPDAGAPLRARLGIAPGAVVALMLAQDFARKGLETAIRAIAAVNDANLILLVAGRDNPTAYRRLATSLGVEKRICFAGQTDDPYAFYRAADLFVLPTRHDPCSLVVLEALAMGVPVITTGHNGAAEAMVPGRHGVILEDPTDVSALAAALVSLLAAPARAAQAAHCLALRPTLSQAAHVDALEAIYRQVQGSTGGPGAIGFAKQSLAAGGNLDTL